MFIRRRAEQIQRHKYEKEKKNNGNGMETGSKQQKSDEMNGQMASTFEPQMTMFEI